MARTAKQKAASRKNLEKARAARKKKSGSTKSNVTKVNFGGPKSSQTWAKRQSTLAPSTLRKKYDKALKQAASAKTDRGRKWATNKADVFWDAYMVAKKRKR